jgi:hypothetical protein
MLEKDLNRDLIHLFVTQGNAWGYKIPDPPKKTVLNSSRRPFDGLARFHPPVNDFYFETKLIKNSVKAFALNRIEAHQLANLLKIKQNGGLTAVILGIWIPRQDYWFLCFDPEFLLNLAKQGKKSISKKELNFYCEKGYNISLRGKTLTRFSPEMLQNRIIAFLPDLEAEIGKIQG